MFVEDCKYYLVIVSYSRHYPYDAGSLEKHINKKRHKLNKKIFSMTHMTTDYNTWIFAHDGDKQDIIDKFKASLDEDDTIIVTEITKDDIVQVSSEAQAYFDELFNGVDDGADEEDEE